MLDGDVKVGLRVVVTKPADPFAVDPTVGDSWAASMMEGWRLRLGVVDGHSKWPNGPVWMVALQSLTTKTVLYLPATWFEVDAVYYAPPMVVKASPSVPNPYYSKVEDLAVTVTRVLVDPRQFDGLCCPQDHPKFRGWCGGHRRHRLGCPQGRAT